MSPSLPSLPLFPALPDVPLRSGLLIYGGGSLAVLGAVAFCLWISWEWTLPFKNLDGPPSPSLIWGNLAAIMRAAPMQPHGEWIKQYGMTFRYKAIFGSNRFFTADPVALSYILSRPDTFPKPDMARRGMANMLGNGVLVAEGHDHRRQRRVLNPSFSPAAVRGMVPIFFDKAHELRDKLLNMIEDDTVCPSPTPAKPEDVVQGGKKIDVMRYLGQATLDIIGIAGFNYDFKALSEPHNELAEAYRTMFSVGQNMTYGAIFQALVPGMRHIPTKNVRTVRMSRDTTRRIGKRLIDDKKRAIAAYGSGGVEKGTDMGKDLLSILIKANMASDLKPDQRMSDDEVLAQITTFMLAGNETSATALTWVLYMLSLHPECQDKLRTELTAQQEERPSMEALAALPYLDAVIRETLRLLAPAPNTIREAVETVVLPLGTPVKGRDGRMVDSVTINKGTTCFIPILSVNKSIEIWGPDAEDFRPERFQGAQSETANVVPGVWGNLLTFLGGARNCIGYRFALAEMKALLFVLIRSFTFEELASKPEIEKKSSIVMRSRVVGEEEAGLQMPLMVKPISA